MLSSPILFNSSGNPYVAGIIIPHIYQDMKKQRGKCLVQGYTAGKTPA